ncbi:MAG: hypothetical protein GXO17_04660 [Thermodesulfobacteria bacterium]|nr:hypothetical protein [Thermodesulfobacteriota bacterium]
MPTWLVSASGEVGTKRSGTQRDLKLLLARNFESRAAALGLRFSWKEERGRFLVEGPEELLSLLRSHIGLGSVSPLWRLPRNDPDSALDWERLLPARPFTYTVYVERFVDPAAKEAGLAFKKKLLERLEAEARKRLQTAWDNRPPEQLSWRLEVYEEEFWLLTDRLRAPGGLPVGCGEKLLVLFSGGPDSLLASYLLARRGQEIELVLFDDGEEGRFELVKKAASALAFFCPGLEIRLWRADYRPVLASLEEMVPQRERCFFCKASMVTLATSLFEKTGAKAVATGEILGEQASQTLPGLLFTAAGAPVLRPVVALNKEDVFSFLREAGLEEVSSLPLPSCPFAPKRPRTRPSKDQAVLRRLLRRLKKPSFEAHLCRYQP